MPNFQHPVTPESSYIWTRSGGVDIKAVIVNYGDIPMASTYVEGVSKARGVVLSNGGFMLRLKDFEALCRGFLAHLDSERGTMDPLLEACAAALARITDDHECMDCGFANDGGHADDCIALTLEAAIAKAKGGG
ncbi:MAG: hypothetical protein U1B30_15870 [Pseudomonadota bacterium]|nr:hypothetical protein [Pseudomonadota bacterium]